MRIVTQTRILNLSDFESTTCTKPPSNEDFIVKKKFVPDVIIEGRVKEHLLVEVKKGSLIFPEAIYQLLYMLMPAAVKQGSAVGVLICTTHALLCQCIIADNRVRFKRNNFKLRGDSLVADMEILFSNIYSQVMTTK